MRKTISKVPVSFARRTLSFARRTKSERWLHFSLIRLDNSPGEYTWANTRPASKTVRPANVCEQNKFCCQKPQKSVLFNPQNSTKFPTIFSQPHPIKYQPATTFPDTTELIHNDYVSIHTIIPFYLKNVNFSNQPKSTKRVTKHLGITSLDLTTKFVSTFVRENIGFSRLYHFST